MKLHNNITIHIAIFLSIVLIFTMEIKISWASHPITIDGLFDDWLDVPLAFTDPIGDHIIEDFAELKITNDNNFLFLNFSFHNGDQLLQDGNEVRLYIDTDNNAETGSQINGIGAELEWCFGCRYGYYHTTTKSDSIFQNDITLRRAPSVSAERFEIAISRTSDMMTISGTQTADTITIVLIESTPNGDILPDQDGGVQYVIYTTNIDPPEPIVMYRNNESDIRIMTYNTWNSVLNGFHDENLRPRFERILKALDPDIIAFQALNNDGAIDSLITSWLPNDAWYMSDTYNHGKFIFSKYPIIEEQYVITSYMIYAALLDTKQELGSNLLLFNTNLRSHAENDYLRQQDADEFIQLMRNWRAGNGPFPIDNYTPYLVLGDFNMYGSGQVLRTFRDGDIWDEATYGEDFSPDWDGTPITDIFSRHTHIRMGYTYRLDDLPWEPGKLDYIFYTDSNIDIGNHFILNTLAISDADLIKYGLERDDTNLASAHLPRVADIAGVHFVRVDKKVGADLPHIFELYPAYPNPFNSTTKIRYNISTIGKVTLKIYNTLGQEIKTLVNVIQSIGQKSVLWDGKDDYGKIVSSGVYIYRMQLCDLIQSRKILYLK